MKFFHDDSLVELITAMNQPWACWPRPSFTGCLKHRELASIATSQRCSTTWLPPPFRNLIPQSKHSSLGSIPYSSNPKLYRRSVTLTITFTFFPSQPQSMCAHIIIHTIRSVKLNYKLNLCFRKASFNRAPVHSLLQCYWLRNTTGHGSFVWITVNRHIRITFCRIVNIFLFSFIFAQ